MRCHRPNRGGCVAARLPLTAALLGVALLCAACGQSGARQATVPVEGKLYWKQVGTPAAGARIVFHPLGDASPEAWPAGYPGGTVAADGSFRLRTYADDDGAPVGEYAVLVSWPRRDAGPGEPDEEAEGEDALAGAYSDPERPRWKVRVKEQGNAPTDFTHVLR